MKVTVFARSLGRKPTGRGFYVRELLQAMMRTVPPLNVDLFCGDDIGLPGCQYHRARGAGLVSDAWRVFRGISSEIRMIRPDVFWATTHFLPWGLPSSLPKVVTVLDLVWKDHPETLSSSNRWVAPLLERGLQEADRIVCISEFTRERLTDHWPGLAGRSEVIPLAAHPRLTRSPQAEAIVRERLGVRGPFVLNVDTFEPRKNLRLILEAVAELRDVTFVHCGQVGRGAPSTVEFARSLPNVRLLGYVEEEDLGALYSLAGAAIFPSLYEGFHLPPLDAASLGTPVLASKIPVHFEILGDSALYFRPDDVGGLRELIRGVLASTAERERLSRAGQARAGQFSWEVSGRRMVELLRAVSSS